MGIAALLAFAPLAMAQKAGTVGPKVGAPLKAALELSAKGQGQQALAKLKEADAVSGKTAFEQQQINEAFCSVHLKMRNYAAAGPACEKGLAQLAGGAANERLKSLAQIFFQPGAGRNLAKTVDFGTKYLQATGGRDPATHFLIGQAHYYSNNHKAAVASFNTAIKNAQAAGQKVEQNWLRFLQDSYTKLGDTAGAANVTMMLVQMYPTPDNWRILTNNLRRQVSADDQATLNVYLLMYELNLLDRADTYSEAAIVAIQAGLPGEAVKVMERGYSTKALEAGDQARSQRILNDAKKRSADQKAAMARLDEQAAASSDPKANIRIGEAWLSYGEADKAIAAAKRAIAKGGADLDEAYLLLGRAHVAKKNSAEAKQAFAQVKGTNFAQIARLWSIRAGQV
jgi:tetratricopeptide (TPR) repeat protein